VLGWGFGGVGGVGSLVLGGGVVVFEVGGGVLVWGSVLWLGGSSPTPNQPPEREVGSRRLPEKDVATQPDHQL